MHKSIFFTKRQVFLLKIYHKRGFYHTKILIFSPFFKMGYFREKNKGLSQKTPTVTVFNFKGQKTDEMLY